MAGYAALVFLLAPRGVSASQFFRGRARDDTDPSLPLLVASAAITWIFAKSISNAANLSRGFGILGGVGYALYYLSF
ncbi:MAG: Na+/proline symporter, partial [Anaerolineae bacterium]